MAFKKDMQREKDFVRRKIVEKGEEYREESWEDEEERK